VAEHTLTFDSSDEISFGSGSENNIRVHYHLLVYSLAHSEQILTSTPFLEIYRLNKIVIKTIT